MRVQPDDLRAASIRRHPSTTVDRARPCLRCGFRPPWRDDVAAALAALPLTWQAKAEGGDELALVAVGRLRDELHAVANRITRILDTTVPAIVAAVEIDAPTALAAGADDELLLPLLGLAADRAAAVVAGLAPADWHRHGQLGDRLVDVTELALLPLHRSHARLGGWRPCR